MKLQHNIEEEKVNGAVTESELCFVWDFRNTDMNELSSCPHYILPPTSSTFAVPALSDTGSLASCDELSCAWLNRLSSPLLVGEITQPLQPLSFCENSFRQEIWTDQEIERDCFHCSGKHGWCVSLTPCKQHANTSLKQHLLYPLVNSPARQHRKGM